MTTPSPGLNVLGSLAGTADAAADTGTITYPVLCNVLHIKLTTQHR